MGEGYAGSGQVVGVDLHRRRSVIVRIDAVTGEQLDCVRIENSRAKLVTEVLKAGTAPRVAIEATFGWVRHEALRDRAGWKDPPVVCRSRPLKLEAA